VENGMSEDFIAHVRRNEDHTWDKPHKLSEHLQDTANCAEGFAAEFNSGQWGRALGLAHDLGKGRPKWQNYLRRKSGYDEEAHLEEKNGKELHAIHGAELVEALYGKRIGRMLAYCIAGHHAGLPDWSSAEGQSSLEFQKSKTKNVEDVDAQIIEQARNAKPSAPPWKFSKGMDLSLWIRMLFSCLVDADYLDTEKYMDQNSFLKRGNYASIEELLERFDRYAKVFDKKSEKTLVNQIRTEIRNQCLKVAKDPQGIYTLTVPTGGGKTLSSLAFALLHAKQHQLKRIIYVIPYTSILEQNADVFRSVLGEDQVIEHHSNVDEDDTTAKTRLSVENWDAPVVVTTSVQFFESLFAAKPSRCRKLHNIVKSVVVIDEAQLVPVEFLEPILGTMQLLVERYQVSFVLSTATQPVFTERVFGGQIFKGLKNVKEIIGTKDEITKLYQTLNRNEIHFPKDLDLPSQWDEIAEELKKHEQVLCIVSDARKSCRELFERMPKGTYHLSALMCGEHRSQMIYEIKEKLSKREPVRVISTQLVEAGVDLDFPVVYRALAGLDSIAQAAGRCNREGKLNNGKVVVFNAPNKAPRGLLRKATETTRSILMQDRDPRLNHGAFEKYFAELYWKSNSLDKEGILTLLDPMQNDMEECSIYFRTAADKFRIIDDSTQRTIFVRYGQGDMFIEMLRKGGPDRWLMRKLQRYTVNVYQNEFLDLKQRGIIEEVHPKIYALSTKLDYSNEVGLMIAKFDYEVENFII
jgi:CRISPR-associated endonuclease/helicase Cas3